MLRRRVLLALALLFVAATGLRLNGYSLPIWHAFLGDPGSPEVLVGTPRPIRGDDFTVILPLSLAQRAHDPPFPVENTDVGFGFNTLVPFLLPVAHPLVLFRPTTWGWFLGPDLGLAWLWWSRLLGLAAVWWLMLLAVSRGATRVAAFATGMFVAAPFFQFWSLRTTPPAIYAGIAFLAALALVRARRPREMLLRGLLLGWGLAAFALTLYPPFQIPLAWLLGSLFLAMLWERRRDPGLRVHPAWRSAALLVALAVVVFALALLRRDAGDAIATILRTDYPGQRLELGGTRTPWELLGANLALPLRVDHWGPLRNICEAAGFLLLAPPLLVGTLLTRRRLGAVEAVLAVGMAAAAIHATVELPAWLARATAFSWVPGTRSVVALGVADALLTVRLLGRPVRASRAQAIGVAAGWAALLALASQRLSALLPELDLGVGVALALLNGLVVFVALRGSRPWIPLAAAALASVALTAWFNPLVRGGTDALLHNPLSQTLVRVDRASGGDSTWLVYGNPRIATLFRAIGVRALNGCHPVPQWPLWRALDPQGEKTPIYNRYAHVVFALPEHDGDPVRIEALGPQGVLVRANPRDPALRALGVTHMLAPRSVRRRFERLSGYRRIARVAAFDLYRVDGDGG